MFPSGGGVMQMRCIAVKSRPFQKKTTAAGVNIRQLLLGFCVLVFGTLFYYFFRSAEHTYFLKFFVHHPDNNFLSPVLVSLGNSLPTFVHVLAFILMTAAFTASRKKGYVAVCLAWFVVDALFELGQGFGDIITPAIPGWFSHYPFLENTRNYFLRGSFDYLDLVSIALGSLAAYMLLNITTDYKEEGTT
jgi:general stress protein CsbA